MLCFIDAGDEQKVNFQDSYVLIWTFIRVGLYKQLEISKL